MEMISIYCCTRIRCPRKMLKETETEETIGFFVTFLPLVAFQLGGRATRPPPPLLATPVAAIAIYISLSSL